IRPHIVHSHTPKGGLLGMMAAWMNRVPVRIYHIRGLPLMTATGRRRTLLRWTERVACSLAHQVLCVSHSVRDVAVAEGLCPPDKIRVLLGGSGNGVDATGRFDPARNAAARAELRVKHSIPADAEVLGFVGRVVRDKGIVELAVAWAVLRDEFPSMHLLLVGPLEPQDPVPPATLEALRADPRVHFVGPADSAPYYAAMDLLVFPTYREGFPNVPLEAAAMGLAVVATRIPGCVDAVADGETGTLVPAADGVALAGAVRAYLRDPALRMAHGRAGRERALRDFGQEAIWTALHAEYLRLLTARGVTA
ncbi:MAG TPA: glycosyltransferase family 4 protein, partial [Longimicrobium sp.]|nr:glycosyltransferase family 4 protein [Longimicrobium sp.]